MSKTLGNVIDPIELINKYGTDALRYYCLAKISPFSDGDFSESKFIESYNADLANGLGNLVARTAKLCENANFSQSENAKEHVFDKKVYDKALEDFKFNDALSFVWQKIATLDKFINEEKPWELQKNNDPKLKEVLAHAVNEIKKIVLLLEPFLPDTAQKISEQFTQPHIKSQSPLFPRI